MPRRSIRNGSEALGHAGSPPLSSPCPSPQTFPGRCEPAARMDPLSTHIFKARKPDPPQNHALQRKSNCIFREGGPGEPPPLLLPQPHQQGPEITAPHPLTPPSPTLPKNRLFIRRAAKNPTPVSGLCQTLITLGKVKNLTVWGGAEGGRMGRVVKRKDQ